MAKISELDELAEVPATDDEIAIRDISDTTEKASGKTKRVTRQNYLGYTEYVALLTQTGTNAPTATVVKNDTGATVTWSYSALGVYLGTFSAEVLTANKTTPLITAINVGVGFAIDYVSTSVVRVRTSTAGGVPSDARLLASPVIVRIYI